MVVTFTSCLCYQVLLCSIVGQYTTCSTYGVVSILVVRGDSGPQPL